MPVKVLLRFLRFLVKLFVMTSDASSVELQFFSIFQYNKILLTGVDPIPILNGLVYKDQLSLFEGGEL